MKKTLSISILAETELLVVGGGLAAAERAVAVARDGTRAILVSAFAFPGWEITGRWDFASSEWRNSPLLAELAAEEDWPLPARVKHILLEKLKDADVPFIGQLHLLEMLPAGGIFAGRSGFHFIAARRIEDYRLPSAQWRLRRLRPTAEKQPGFCWKNNRIAVETIQKSDYDWVADQLATASPVGEIAMPQAGGKLDPKIEVAWQASTAAGCKTGNISFDPTKFSAEDQHDVIVAGGGTAGMAAAIAAARQGLRVLLLERFDGPGGSSTLGRISNHYYGNRVGFAAEVDRAAAAYANKSGYTPYDGSWQVEAKRHALLEMAAGAGVELRFNCEIVAALRSGRRVCGVTAVDASGLRHYPAEVVIDATGNADVAAAAGAECEFLDGEPALQGTGVPALIPGEENSNSDFTFADDGDILDVNRVLVLASRIFNEHFDFGPMVNTRERRRIRAIFNLQSADAFAERSYSDCIVRCRSCFDTHGFTMDGFFELIVPQRHPMYVELPYRALLPKTLDGLLVTGIGIGAHRDAMPFVRMQPDVLNQGYAAGLAAALAVKSAVLPGEIDVKALQKQLVDTAILPREFLHRNTGIPHFDPLPLDAPNLPECVASVLIEPARYLDELRRRFAASENLRYAQLLALLDDESGATALAEEVAKTPFSCDVPGWDYTGMGQMGRCMSRIDSIIQSLSRLKVPFARKAVRLRLGELTADSAFSHFRSIGVYLQRHPDPKIVPVLEKLYSAFEGTAVSEPATPLDTAYRNWMLKRFYCAAALLACSSTHSGAKAFMCCCIQNHLGGFATPAAKVLKSLSGGKTK
ncbi:MAG: FAD-dependent oxidoreductase [Lentisphaeria bacterium]